MKTAAPMRKCRHLLLFVTAVLLLAGCSRSMPISYYQVTPVKEKTTARAAENSAPVIGIGPVRLQEHLDRPQLILRTGTSRLQLADRHRWAEPLAANIAWVLRDNLAVHLGTEHLLLYPWPLTTPPNYQISLDILRCEGAEDGAAQLEALWTVSNRDGTELPPPQRSSYRIPPATPDYAGLVNALSEALSRLSLDIARQITQLQTSGK